MIELDGFETVHPAVGVTAATVEADIAGALEGILAAGMQPLRVLVGVASYRALLARDGLRPRTFEGKGSALFVTSLGVTLVVDCDRKVPDGDACVTGIDGELGRA